MNNISSETTAVNHANPARTFLLSGMIFLVALNLRPAITSLAPLLPEIGHQMHISPGWQGVLAAIPLLSFALISPFAPMLSARWGGEKTLFFALAAIGGGILMRSFLGQIGLWVGSLLIGAAIAVGNVLVPAVVGRDFPQKTALATGVYTSAMGAVAAVASAVAIPAAASLGWASSLAWWAVLAFATAFLWSVRLRFPRAVAGEAATFRGMWTNRRALLLTGYMALQAAMFYIMVTWLPTIALAAGFSAQTGGYFLSLFQLVSIFSSLTVPVLMRRDSVRFAAVFSTIPMVAGCLGLLLAPKLAVLWVVLAGLSTGATFMVAMALISLCFSTPRQTTQLSAMVQSLGYLGATLGPILIGWIVQVTHGWTLALLVIGLLAALHTVVAFPVGAQRLAR